jgi:hypothetical protein
MTSVARQKATYSESSENVFDKDHALELENEEVGQLMDLLKDEIQGFPADGVVTFGTERRNDPVHSEGFSDNFETSNRY